MVFVLVWTKYKTFVTSNKRNLQRMRAMEKRLILILLLAAIMLSGCGSQTLTTVVHPVKEINNFAVKSNPDSSQKLPDKGNSTDDSKVTDKADTEKATKAQSSSQPDTSMGHKMNFNILDKLDNTKYSWWITLNKLHKTPGIPTIAEKIIDKYDGIYIGDTSKKVIYLTFDEGYENGFTPKILDTLKQNEVKSIFFVTGPYIKDHSDLVKRMLNEGHLVGNHTINHLSLPTVSDSSLEKELSGLEKQFTLVTGKGMKYMRPPSGEYSEKVLAAAKQLGYKTVFWSYAYADFDINKQKGADHAYKVVMDNLHNGEVLLLHAVSKDNAEALDKIIKEIKSEGYEIRQLDL